MPERPLTKDLLNFFRTRIQSLERLEILCLLVEHPSKSWSAGEIFHQIQSTEKSVAECLQHFVKHNLAVVDADNVARFPPKPSELTTAAVQLIHLYRERPVSVIRAI